MSISANSKLQPRHQPLSAELRIFVKDVADTQNRKRPLTVRTWSTIKDVKDLLRQHMDIPPSRQRLFYGPLMTSGRELPNHRSLHDAGIYRSGETILLEVRGNDNNNASSPLSSALPDSNLSISTSFLDSTPRLLKRTIQQARRGISLGLKPQRTLDGSGGTYILCDARKCPIAVFKPADEEAYAINNPRGYLPAPTCLTTSNHTQDPINSCAMRAGIRPGECCLREVAACLLDHSSFSGVPDTTLVEARHKGFNHNGSGWNLTEGGASVGNHVLHQNNTTPTTFIQSRENAKGDNTNATIISSNISPSHNIPKKVGSFQSFVKSECTMDDLSPSLIPIDEVHKIAILDIRILNADRNSANLLCRRNPESTSTDDEWELVPIDHGFCLRESADVASFDWCWLDWPQLKKPLSQKSMQYILNLDVEGDVRLLREQLNLPRKACDFYRASCGLLKAGINAGMTLYDIAILCCRSDPAGELPSRLEALMTMASDIAQSAVHNGRWHHAAASKALADQLVYHEDNTTVRSSLHRVTTNPAISSLAISSSSNFYEESTHMPTPMASSSGSDSSSDTGDFVGEREECDEWAAAVMDRVKLEVVSPLISSGRNSYRQRAISIISASGDSTSTSSSEDFSSTDQNENESDSFSSSSPSSSSSDIPLSSSPLGFWLVRPGMDDDDDLDENWSPHLSPRPEPISVCFKPPKFDNISSLSNPPIKVGELTKAPPLLLPLAASNPKPLQRSLSYSAFSFKDAAALSNSSLTPKTPLRGSTHEMESLHQSMIKSSGLGMLMSNNIGKVERGSIDHDNDQYRVYFLKFIDLLIARETHSGGKYPSTS